MIASRKSRYAGTNSAVYVSRDGTQIPYLLRRFVPQSSTVTELLKTNPSRAGMRLDLLAGRLVGDPEQFWRLLDANDGVNPFDFIDETMGEPLRVPRPSDRAS